MTAYVTATELRSVKPLNDTTRFPSALLEGYVAQFEEIVEQYLGAAFVPRTFTATVRGTDNTQLVLPSPNVLVTALSAVTIDGTAFTTDERNDVTIWGDEGILERTEGWSGTKVVVQGTRGAASVPAVLVQACKEYVRAKALKGTGNQPREAAGPAGVDGSTYPAASTKPTGVREADRLISTLPSYRIPGIG